MRVAQTLRHGESADPPYLLSGSPQAPNTTMVKSTLKRSFNVVLACSFLRCEVVIRQEKLSNMYCAS